MRPRDRRAESREPTYEVEGRESRKTNTSLEKLFSILYFIFLINEEKEFRKNSKQI